MERHKYPRTFHVPWSPSVTSDDKRWDPAELEAVFGNEEIVVTSKLDGENSTVYSDGYCHARSASSGDHPSRHWLKASAFQIAQALTEGQRVCGENLYATHSLTYDSLPSYFLVFGLYNAQNECVSWDDTVTWAKEAGLPTVPVLYRGKWSRAALDATQAIPSEFGPEREGFVVRVARSFPWADQSKHVAKWVRPNHVQTEEHWMLKPVVVNGLRNHGCE